MNSCPQTILIIARHPAPYNFDLFNAFAESQEWDPFVVYVYTKSPESHHDYRAFPKARFSFHAMKNHGSTSMLRNCWQLLRIFQEKQPKCCLICGYVGIIHLAAFALCILKRVTFAVWVDWFRIGPANKGGQIGTFVRNIFRKLLFSQAALILTCGVMGIKSAIEAGCPNQKVVNFPYTIDTTRIKCAVPSKVPNSCAIDLAEKRIVIMFSGQHIFRKGLPTLLEAISYLDVSESFKVWIEGSGPLRPNYEILAQSLGISDRCIFLGFCQMDIHSWLITNADIIVVPSLFDPWGIVVDEGMQLGKAVVASKGVFSGVDRIVSGSNGFLFDSGDSRTLAGQLARLISNRDLRKSLGTSAKDYASRWTPARNVVCFSKHIKNLCN